ncbi:non-specific lipid transfer protein GPI-anchored 3-like [Macadamia integrifolia]|uniref:non-specific lipid transfer protein GPI-anchored 3-like n=1 Tax=Macadamia integrifolia TaxID=60698 RepID=UPI001C4EE74C|nr:non-specific lipid transfer protein GPI-anchored 3-like [Macadamia integrifolia]
MESKLLLSLILVSSWVFLGFSQPEIPSDIADCVKNLVPCQKFLKAPSPPSTCCIPLKQMFTDQPKCPCKIFDNKDLLKQFNVTQEDALSLPKGCGIAVDVSMCSKVAGTPGNSSSTSPAPGASTGAAPANSTTAAKKSSADGLSAFSGLGFIATIVALLSVF